MFDKSRKKQKLSARHCGKLMGTSLKYQTKMFFQNSTLHGVRYIAEFERPFYERLMWFCFVAAGTVATIIIIMNLWDKFQTNPTITGLDTDFHSWDVAFPALTLCELEPGNNTYVQDFVEELTEEDDLKTLYSDFLTALPLLKYENMQAFDKFTKDKRLARFNRFNLKQLTFKVASHCEDILDNCIWKGDQYNCCQGFFPLFTENGFCFTFNSREHERSWPDTSTLSKIGQKSASLMSENRQAKFSLKNSRIVNAITKNQRNIQRKSLKNRWELGAGFDKWAGRGDKKAWSVSKLLGITENQTSSKKSLNSDVGVDQIENMNDLNRELFNFNSSEDISQIPSKLNRGNRAVESIKYYFPSIFERRSRITQPVTYQEALNRITRSVSDISSDLAPQVEDFEQKYIEETDAKLSFAFDSSSAMLLIYIHNSMEVPTIDANPQHEWDWRVNRISFSVKDTYTTDDARQLSIRQRRCVYADEIQLKVDKTMYTYTACTRQCRMETSMKLCGCIPHFYPAIEGFKHCNLKELGCVIANLAVIKNEQTCSCELGCSTTVYEVEKLDEKSESGTALEVEFVSWPMMRYKREVLFGWVDLLVSFGGIAGLFLGFSLLSGIEIVYYFTIRAGCMIYAERDEVESMALGKSINKGAVKEVEPAPPYTLNKPSQMRPIKFLEQSESHFVRRINRVEPVFPTRVMKLPKREAIFPPFGIEFIN